jgi:hypothetical protein
VARTPLATDTSSAIEQSQIERWREMSASEKAALVTTLSRASVELAQAGVRLRYPHASPSELFLRLAIVMLGRELATRVYPGVAQLDQL